MNKKILFGNMYLYVCRQIITRYWTPVQFFKMSSINLTPVCLSAPYRYTYKTLDMYILPPQVKSRKCIEMGRKLVAGQCGLYTNKSLMGGPPSTQNSGWASSHTHTHTHKFDQSCFKLIFADWWLTCPNIYERIQQVTPKKHFDFHTQTHTHTH